MHYWVQSFREKARISMEAKHRETIALDDTVIKLTAGASIFIATLDVRRNEVVWMRVYAARNYFTTLDFVQKVLKYCKNKLVFITMRDRGTAAYFSAWAWSTCMRRMGGVARSVLVFSPTSNGARSSPSSFNINFRGRLKKRTSNYGGEEPCSRRTSLPSPS